MITTPFSFQKVNKKNRNEKDVPVLITGGAGFIGANLAHQLMLQGETVIVYDNLSRPGSEKNLRWLADEHSERLKICINDVRNYNTVKEVVANVKLIFHFASQVAVTTSIENPVHDFDVNVKGTLNILEAVRTSSVRPPVIMTSTNKVYGGLSDVPLKVINNRYVIATNGCNERGFDEKRPLDFQSPYGCSKGAAEQYVLDYARTYNLNTVVFRMSCIYGPHQFGNEDQGWVVHFLKKAIYDEDICIYGNGCQVRDVLHVNDLVDAFITAWNRIETVRSNVFNIGGGPENSISILELIDYINELYGKKMIVQYAPWRTGDQKYYVSDVSKYKKETGWYPKVNVKNGLEDVYKWVYQDRKKAEHIVV
jgi:CDP-paratose 2-epimerase